MLHACINLCRSSAMMIHNWMNQRSTRIHILVFSRRTDFNLGCKRHFLEEINPSTWGMSACSEAHTDLVEFTFDAFGRQNLATIDEQLRLVVDFDLVVGEVRHDFASSVLLWFSATERVEPVFFIGNLYALTLHLLADRRADLCWVTLRWLNRIATDTALAWSNSFAFCGGNTFLTTHHWLCSSYALYGDRLAFLLRNSSWLLHLMVAWLFYFNSPCEGRLLSDQDFLELMHFLHLVHFLHIILWRVYVQFRGRLFERLFF